MPFGNIEKFEGRYLGTDQTLAAATDTDPITQRTEHAYQQLQQMAKDHELLDKLRPFRDVDTLDQSHVDRALREIATYHARLQDLEYYLGSSLGYDAEQGNLWLDTQIGKIPGTEYQALTHEFSKRTDPLPIEIMAISTHPMKGSSRTAVFGSAAFNNAYLPEITHIGDLIP